MFLNKQKAAEKMQNEYANIPLRSLETNPLHAIGTLRCMNSLLWRVPFRSLRSGPWAGEERRFARSREQGGEGQGKRQGPSIAINFATDCRVTPGEPCYLVNGVRLSKMNGGCQ